MGFKRTTEGRVFFQNGTQGSVENNDLQNNLDTLVPATSRPLTGARQDNNQAQIIALLKSLNARLQTTQNDREHLQQELETYKAMVLSLQDKSEQQEREAAQIKKKLSESDNGASKKAKEAEQLSREALKEFEEARRLILEIEERAERTESLIKKQQAQVRQSEEQARVKFDMLEQKQNKQSQDILSRLNVQEERQKTLDGRIEDSLNATLKIERKIDKAIQERARLIRKLERIEETVLQTNEAMNSRAMVLLTDQGAAVQNSASRPLLTADQIQARASNDDQSFANEYESAPIWKKPMRMQATSVSLIVLGAALLGWTLSEVQKPEAFSYDVAGMLNPESLQANSSGETSAAQDLTEPPVLSADQPARDFTQDTALSDDAAAAFDKLIEEQDVGNAEVASGYDVSGASVDTLNNDINAIDLNDEAQVLKLLEENPDALAAQLNAIEPSSVPGGAEFQDGSAGNVAAAITAPVEGEAAASAMSSSPTFNYDDLNLDAVELPSKLNGTLASRIQSDSSLPENIGEIEKSAFSGNGNAQHDLAAIYTAGHGGVQQNYERAALWFEEAAHNGIANARYNLGVLYHQGIGVKQDTEKAFQWYKTAAALGHPEAQYNLGIAYIEGIGVSYDPVKAGTFFESAALGGVTEAAYNLGLIFENGLLGKAQPDTALMWYKTAADKGSPEAKAALEQLGKTMGMSVAEVNKMIDGMDKPQSADTGSASQKKTEKLTQAAPAQNHEDARHNLIADVQENLMDMGLYPGPVDGVGGAMTRDAVRTYQSRHDLFDNGEITPDLLAHMHSRGYIGEAQNNEQGSRD